MAQNVIIDIDASTRNFEQALDGLTAKVQSTADKMDKAFSFGGEASKSIKNTTSAARELHSTLKDISIVAAGNVIADGFQKAVKSIKDVGNEIYQTTGRMQSLQMAMKGIVTSDLLKTGQVKDYTEATQKAEAETKKLMDWFKDLSLKSPYELTEVMDAFKDNANMGQTVETAKKTTEAILALGAGLGMGQAEMKRFSAALAQTGATGRITAMDLRQFANNGFGMDKMNQIFAILSQKYQIAIKDNNDFNKAVAEGKITTDDFFNALNEFAVGNYGGAIDAMASTIEGLKSSLGDIKTNVINDLFLESSKTVSKALVPYVEYLMQLLTGGDFSRLGDNINNWVQGMLEPFQKFGETLQNGTFSLALESLKDFFSGKNFNLGAVKVFLNDIGGAEFADKWIEKLIKVKGYFDKILEHKDLIIAGLKGIGIAFATAFAVNKLMSFMTLLMKLNNPITQLALAGAAFGIAWDKNLFGIQDKFKGFIEYIKSLVETFKNGDIGDVFEKIKTDAIAKFEEIKSALKQKFAELKEGGVKGFFDNMFGENVVPENVVKVFEEIVNWIDRIVQGIGGLAAGFASLALIKGAFEVFTTLIAVLSSIPEIIGVVVSAITAAPEIIIAALMVVGFAIVGQFVDFGKLLSNVFETIKTNAIQTFSDLKEKVGEKLSGLWETVQPLVIALGGVAALIGTALAGTIMGIGTFIVGLINGIIKGFDELISALISGIDFVISLIRLPFDIAAGLMLTLVGVITGDNDLIEEAVSNMVGRIKHTWNSFKSFFIELWAFLKELVAGVWQTICDAIESVDISAGIGRIFGEDVVQKVEEFKNKVIEKINDIIFAWLNMTNQLSGRTINIKVGGEEREISGTAYEQAKYDNNGKMASFRNAQKDWQSLGNLSDVKRYQYLGDPKTPQRDRKLEDFGEISDRELAAQNKYKDNEVVYKSWYGSFDNYWKAVNEAAQKSEADAEAEYLQQWYRDKANDVIHYHNDMQRNGAHGYELRDAVDAYVKENAPWAKEDKYMQELLEPVYKNIEKSISIFEEDTNALKENTDAVNDNTETTTDTGMNPVSTAATADLVANAQQKAAEDTAEILGEILGDENGDVSDKSREEFIADSEKLNEDLADKVDKTVKDATENAKSGGWLNGFWDGIKETLGFGKEIKFEMPEQPVFDESSTQEYMDMVKGLRDFMQKDMPDVLKDFKKESEDDKGTQVMLEYAVKEMTTLVKNKDLFKDDEAKYAQAMESVIKHSELPKEIQDAFITALNTEGVSTDFIAAYATSLIQAINEAGLLVSNSVEESKKESSVLDGYSKEYKSFVESEYDRFLDSNKTEHNRGYQKYLTEHPNEDITIDEYLKSIDKDIESWYKSDMNGTNGTAEFLSKFMPQFEYNMGIKMDGFTELTKDNQGELDEMAKAFEDWATMSSDALYGNLSADEIITQMTSLVDTLTDGQSTAELKTGLDLLLAGVTDSETQMKILATVVRALNGDVDAIKSINEAILAKTGSKNDDKGQTTGTTVGNAAIDSFNKSLKEFNDARKTNDADTMNKAGLDMYSWYLATWNDEVDKFNRDMDSRVSYEQFINNIEPYMNEFIRSSQAGHTNSAVHDSVLEQNLSWQQQQEKKRLEEEAKKAEYEKKKQELYEKYGDNPPEELLKELETETEEKNPLDKLLSMFEGDTLTQLQELIGAGGLGALFGGVDAEAMKAWEDLADPINQVADAMLKLRDALVGTDDMQGLGTEFKLSDMFGSLDTDAVKAWGEFTGPIGAISTAMLSLRDALIGTQEMEGLGADFKLSDLFPQVDEQTIESWNTLSGAISAIANSILLIQELFGGVAEAEGGTEGAGAGGGEEGEGGGMNLLTLLFGTPETIGAVMEALKGGEEGEGLTTILDAIATSIGTITGNFEAWCTMMQGTLPAAAEIAKKALGEITVSENGATMGKGNSLYTALSGIETKTGGIVNNLSRMVDLLRKDLIAAIQVFKQKVPMLTADLGAIESAAAAAADALARVLAMLIAIAAFKGGSQNAVDTVNSVAPKAAGEKTGGGGLVPQGSPKVGPSFTAAGGGLIPRYGTAIVGEHGPEIIQAGNSAMRVFTNSTLNSEIASTRRELNQMASAAEAVSQAMWIHGDETANYDYSQNFTNNFPMVIGDDAFRAMIDEEIRAAWRREIRLAN